MPWYEGEYYLVVLKDHVNLFFSLRGLSTKEKPLFESSGKTMRHVKIHSLDEIDEMDEIGEKKIVQLLRMVYDK